ncbi:MAG: hypothetical protein ACW98K_17875 [Candidatus Kariarchaeaceae archaeon]
MDAGGIFVIVIIGIIIYKVFSRSKTPPPYRQQPGSDQFRTRRTGRGSGPRPQDQTRSTIAQSAKRQERLGNLDEASRLYLQSGQIFSAAKMKALKGPQEANTAIDLIRQNAPHQVEMISQNLVNEFYYRLNQPATAAALLHGMEKHEEATAVEIAANIASPTIQTAPAPVSSSISEEIVADDLSVSIPEPSSSIEVDEPQVEESLKPVPDAPVAVDQASISNTLMMASMDLAQNCAVCRRSIKSGDSFLYCLNCGSPGHFKHLAEIMKVTGKCPNCKERLVSSMYDLD